MVCNVVGTAKLLELVDDRLPQRVLVSLRERGSHGCIGLSRRVSLQRIA